MGGGSSGYGRGGGGGGSGGGGNVAQVAKESTDEATVRSKVNDYLEQKLMETRPKDPEEVRRRVKEMVDVINDGLDGNVTHFDGGSASKDTFVEGISDYDIVVRLNDTELADRLPQDALKQVAEKLAKKYGPENVKVGVMAVTVTDPKTSREYQAVPAVSAGKGKMKFPEPGKNKWGKVAQPNKFARELARADRRENGRVKDAIRMFKLMQEKRLYKEERLKGYHIEAIAYMAFQNPGKANDHRTALEYMTRAAANIVRRPIKDSTGQSRHVDDYLGARDSSERTKASHALTHLADKMKEARLSGNGDNIKEIL